METSAVNASWRPIVTLLWRSLKTRPLCHEPWRSVEAEWYRLSPLKYKNHNSYLWISLWKQWSSLVIFVNRHKHVMRSRQNQSWSYQGSDKKETHETYFSQCQALLLLQQPSEIILFCLFTPIIYLRLMVARRLTWICLNMAEAFSERKQKTRDKNCIIYSKSCIINIL